MSRDHRAADPEGPLGFGILTVSDSRTPETDLGGRILLEAVERAGHLSVSYAIVPDGIEEVRAAVADLAATEDVDLVVVTGGTGVSPRDSTPEAVEPLFERRLPGFGELFRLLSWDEVGPAAFLSRAGAGLIAGKPVFLLPGSPAAVRLAIERLILPEAAHLVAVCRAK